MASHSPSAPSSPLARAALVAVPLGLALFAGCASTHTPASDAAVDAPCPGDAPTCVQCGGDVLMLATCVSGAWECPTGWQDPDTCAPTCWGPPPASDCVCDTSTETPTWVCDDACPTNAANPGACSVEGASCSSGSRCSGGTFCRCSGGTWQCAVAERDAACTCDARPTVGGPCTLEEGSTCGSCDPTPEQVGWPVVACEAGVWTALECPASPTRICPANTEAAVRTACTDEGLRCGDSCCGFPIVCTSGVWQPGPIADCSTCTGFACGDGQCVGDQVCVADCGPAGGSTYACHELTPTCDSCDCLDVPAGTRCTERDGHVFLESLCF